MDRKNFIKNSLLATGAICLPNPVWAFDNYNIATGSHNQFFSLPNLKRFKISETGTKFFESELSILKPKVSFTLHRKYFISENTEGICTPALLETNKNESLVFIPELYNGKKFNGFIVKVCKNGLCEETQIFTHENQGCFAFWGKEYLGNPTLYHYNFETLHLMRMHLENEQWINYRVMPIYPKEMKALYQQQLQNVVQGQLTQQYGYDFEIHKDSFYQFLALKHSWEEGVVTKEKNTYEKENPSEIYSENKLLKTSNVNSDDYTNPFVPIWCLGDDASHSITSPTKWYKEVVGSKIQIPNMPAYRSQNALGECRAFSLATIMQKYTCDKWKSNIPNCSNPPPDLDISSFGMLIYTNRNAGQVGTFSPNVENSKNMFEIIIGISKNPSFILNSCKPFSNIVNSFSLKGEQGIKDRDKFFDYLKNLYDDKKSLTEANVAGCPECLKEIERNTGIKKDLVNLKKAFAENSFDGFLYILFFEGCELEGFADGFMPIAYPYDKTNATTTDLKNKIIEGVKKGKPVLLPGLCISTSKDGVCSDSHSIVISGFKKVCDEKNNCRDVFKVHNSWGESWQKANNDGWLDADMITSNIVREPNQTSTSRIMSGAVIWLEP